ncbi:MAG: AtpZ/AtpI family protein [Rhodomicrobium sp.]
MASSGDGEPDERKALPESSDRLRERLRELERKLEKQDGEQEGPSEEELGRRSTALGTAFKLTTELVAGVFVGGFLGWLLDRWLGDSLFGTKGVFLVVFLLLGIAAGFLNVIRAARGMGDK